MGKLNFCTKMMKKIAQQLLSSTKKTSKPKPQWLTNIMRTTSPSKLTTKPNPSSSPHRDTYISQSQVGTKLWSLTQQCQMGRHFCTNTASSVEFTVRRSEPELVGPAKPTPREVKPLSYIDAHPSLHVLVPVAQLYRYDPSMQGKDPVRVIREALAQALVFYYPLAGRVREMIDGRLSVDCTGEGVLFVEADADVELAQLGDPPRPPFPWFEKLLHSVPLTGGILDSPLLFIQVTRLKCGGFIIALRFNHIMCDAFGFSQFLNDVGQIARGAGALSITPVWNRELLGTTRGTHHLHQQVRQQPSDDVDIHNHSPNMSHRSFFLGPSTLLQIRDLFPEHLRTCSTTFDLLTAFLWRCRAAALHPYDKEAIIHLIFAVSARNKVNSVVPVGYYGNGMTLGIVGGSARRLCESSVEYALKLVKKAKEEGIQKCMRWQTNPPRINLLHKDIFTNRLAVSDIRRAGFGDVDFGWGKATYSGPVKLDIDGSAFYQGFRNGEGQEEVLVSMCFQAQIMDKFETELNNMLSHGSA